MEIPGLSTLIPSGTVFALLTYLVIHFVRQGGADRSQYLEQITALREAHDAQIGSIIGRHDQQMDDLRGQVAQLRGEIDKLRVDLETERQLRWRAEDAAAKWRRRFEEIADDQT